ncbi:MAG: MotA/TolQ/ExbB proton channel family protein [Deltaproteobacteria bacterium]|nr:MAG: MotA/TolQ/ExbB proton channel family protein [Deltaproteobacteria bacterium]
MEQNHIFQILWDSDPVVKLTLLILLGFSVGSWAIVVYKYKELKKWKISAARFFEAFWRTPSLEELLAKSAGQENPLFNIFRTGISDIMRKNKGEGRKVTLSLVQRRIENAISMEEDRIERYIPFLATTGSVAPFIGLFGTVWGILAAFWKIGKAGSSSLAVVGPFIAEALIATAVGLAAAIPAVIFYNIFVNQTRSFLKDVNGFAEDLSQRIQQDYFS